jgi:hypothetical protein
MRGLQLSHLRWGQAWVQVADTLAFQQQLTLLEPHFGVDCQPLGSEDPGQGAPGFK